MNYIDFIPRELIELILFNFNDTNRFLNLYAAFPSLKNIIVDFWNRKVKKDFPMLNPEVIPTYLFEYKNQDIFAIIINHSIIKEIYESALREFRNLGTFNNAPRYFLSNIKNYNLLLIPEEMRREKIFVDRLMLSLYRNSVTSFVWLYKQYSNYFISLYIPELGNMIYEVSPTEAFNLLLHIISNGGRTQDD